MKKILKLTVVVLLTFNFSLLTAFAQSPEKMTYQSVIRNASDQLVTNQAMGMQISILQGSTSGTEVYVETHSPTSNANGLVSIEIGTGTSSDDFSAIDWNSGPYFLKTETDPTTAGGTNYTITGTSQLLSVPYALHAKTVENVDYTQITNTPFIPSDLSDLTDNSSLLFDRQWSSLTGTPTTISGYGITDAFDGDWSSLSGTAPNVSIFNNDANYLTSEVDGSITNEIQTISRTGLAVTLSNGGGTFQDSVNVYTAGTGIDITNNVVSANTYSVGDFAQGGIVFWVDETGQHGLVCAKVDQSTGVRWYAGTDGNTQAKGDGPFAGEANTSIIIAAQVAIGDDGSTYAARICNELQVTEGGKTYGDWYLPAKEELNLMYQNKATIGATAGANGGSAFVPVYYWSSTEANFDYAWVQDFDLGFKFDYFKVSSYCVRSVRAF